MTKSLDVKHLRTLMSERDLTKLVGDENRELAYHIITAMNESMEDVEHMFSGGQISKAISLVEQLPKFTGTITCGNCRGKHETVADVRECYKGKHVVTTASGKRTETAGALPAFATDPATQPQLDKVKRLSRDKDLDKMPWDKYPAENETWMNIMDGKAVSKREASNLITAMLDVPYKKRNDWPNIPDGKYATEHSGVVEFWEVDKPQRGAYAGCVFIEKIVGGVGDWQRVRVSHATIDAAMVVIDKDPKAAARLFGYKTKSCGRCGSPLSKVQSRAAGFGKKCASKLGWDYPSRDEALRLLNEMGIDLSELEDANE